MNEVATSVISRLNIMLLVLTCYMQIKWHSECMLFSDFVSLVGSIVSVISDLVSDLISLAGSIISMLPCYLTKGLCTCRMIYLDQIILICQKLVTNGPAIEPSLVDVKF